jgi:hypothetical protein
MTQWAVYETGRHGASAVLDNVDMYTQEIRPYLSQQEPVLVNNVFHVLAPLSLFSRAICV